MNRELSPNTYSLSVVQPVVLLRKKSVSLTLVSLVPSRIVTADWLRQMPEARWQVVCRCRGDDHPPLLAFGIVRHVLVAHRRQFTGSVFAGVSMRVRAVGDNLSVLVGQ